MHVSSRKGGEVGSLRLWDRETQWGLGQPWQAFDDLDAPPERVTGAEVPMPYAANLEAAALPQVSTPGMLAPTISCVLNGRAQGMLWGCCW